MHVLSLAHLERDVAFGSCGHVADLELRTTLAEAREDLDKR